jgi:hypothetical protein
MKSTLGESLRRKYQSLNRTYAAKTGSAPYSRSRIRELPLSDLSLLSNIYCLDLTTPILVVDFGGSLWSRMANVVFHPFRLPAYFLPLQLSSNDWRLDSMAGAEDVGRLGMRTMERARRKSSKQQKHLQSVFRLPVESAARPSPDSTKPTVFHARKSHRKSREGCGTCKIRRIKVRRRLC